MNRFINIGLAIIVTVFIVGFVVLITVLHSIY